MYIGIIGAGNIGGAIATRAARSGINVLLSNSRGPESLGSIVASIGPGAKAATREEASQADIVVIAVPWSRIPAAVAGLDFMNRIVIDATNPIEAPDFRVADLGGRTSSEIVADLVPGAFLVKAFNTLTPELLLAETPPGGRRTIFLSSDHQEAKTQVSLLLDRMGFTPIDMGGLVDGGIKHQFPGGPLAAKYLVRFPMN